jgi:hypothetical protein
MEIKLVNTSGLTHYEENPRTIDVFKFEALKESIAEFQDMLNLRPIIIDKQNRVLCGNMRFKACVELGITKIPAIVIGDMPEDKIKELVVKDNLSYGEWDWDMLEFGWDMDLVDKWLGRPELDYSALDYQDLETEIERMQNGVKKAIQIKVLTEHYDEAKELEKQCRDNDIYIGGLLLDEMLKIKAEYEKN